MALVLVQHQASLPLLILTQGAYTSIIHSPAASAASGGSWGMARVVRLEQPSRHVLAIDVSLMAISAVHWAAGRAMELGSEVEMAQEGQTPSTPRLRQSGVLTSTLSSPGRAVCASTWVVSGGLGGLGLRAASMLIDVGVFSAVLCSRSGNIKQADQALLRQLAARNASCALCCDVGDAAEVAGVVWRTTSLGRPASVLHAAGVLSDSLVRAMAMRQFVSVGTPKAHGVWHLHLSLIHI